jgi:hypothetical protein
MKKKNINITIKFGNKVFYSLITILILVVIAGISIALDVPNWEIHGHSPDDIGIGTKSVQDRLCAVETNLGMADSSCGGALPECTSDDDCEDGATCTNRVCVPVVPDCIEIASASAGKYGIGSLSETTCISSKGCILKRHVNNKGTITDDEVTFIQSPSDDTWTSTSGNRNGKNGGSDAPRKIFSLIAATFSVNDDCNAGGDTSPEKICIHVGGTGDRSMTLSACPA